MGEWVRGTLYCRYGGFSLGGRSTQTPTQTQHLQESASSIRTRYQVEQV